jgi:hypothetical protein
MGNPPSSNGIHRCNGNGNGSCVITVDAPKDAPKLGAEVSHRLRHVTVVVELVAGANGTIAVGASNGGLHAPIHHHGRHYTFTANQAGTWTVTVAFIGRDGWRSQHIFRTVAVA